MIEGLFRMTPGQFKRAALAGIYQDRKVELLGGIVFEMPPNAPHVSAVWGLLEALRVLAPDPAWFVAKQDPIVMGRWLPVPDLAVLRGGWVSYKDRLPRASEVALVAEVSDSTYPKDRRLKYRKYASRRIPVYWIVDLNRRVVEVHSDPAGAGRSASYWQAATYGAGDRVPVVLDGAGAGAIAVDDLLP